MTYGHEQFMHFIQLNQQEASAMMEHQRMQINDKKNAIVDMVTRLDREDLNTIIDMLDAAQGNDFMTGTFIGLIKGVSISRFDTNLDGHTMEEAMAAEDWVRDAESKRDAGPGAVVDTTPRDDSNDPEWVFPEDTPAGEQIPLLREDGYPFEHYTEQELIDAQNELNLDADEEYPGRFICRGCGISYVSIADRNLRDECHGCIAKSAQG